MARVVVVGAGPAAAAVALAAKADGGHEVVVIDIGERLEGAEPLGDRSSL